MKEIVNHGSRLDQLRELLVIMAIEIDDKPGARDMAALIKQYRETLKEIEELEGATAKDDEIAEIISAREAGGKPGAVRKNRA